MHNWLSQWGKIVASSKSRWITVLVWVAVIAVISIVWPQVNDEESGSNNLLPEDAMSVEASKIMEEQFPNDSGVPLLLVWYRDGGLVERDFEIVQALYEDLAKQPLGYQSLIPRFDQMPMQALAQAASGDSEALTTPVFFNEAATADELQQSLETLKEKVVTLTKPEVLENDLEVEGLHVRFTGPVGIQTDATELFSQADLTLLFATVLLVLVLLIVLYRSPILAIVPLVGVGFAYGLISPLLGFMAGNGWIVVDAQAISIMTVLLFGAGTDYCLFLVSRYRDELQLEVNKYKALQLAIANSGSAIMMSALTTVLGLLTLSLAQYASYDRFAVPFSLAIFVMAIAVLTLLPAMLALFGRVAFFPFIPRTPEMLEQLQDKRGRRVRQLKQRTRFSKAAGRLVTERPWQIIVISLIFLGGLAFVVPRIDYTYGVLQSFPDDMPSREGFTIISEHYPPGEIAPVNIVVDTDGKELNLQKDLISLPIVESVSDAKQGESNRYYLEYTVTFGVDPYSSDAVEQIENLKIAAINGLENAGISNANERVWIGGETATLYDTENITRSDQNIIIPVVLLIIALLLLVYLKSVVAMVYLLLTVVISFLSALGLGWLIIHYGMGAPAMQGLIPLYAFVFLVALGEDYNIFMISSIWNKRKRMSMKQAIAEGVGETSSVISSAGLILAGTFSVLAVMPMQVLVQFGIVTAIGVILDTFIVRPLLVPAITTVLGRFAFWPGALWKKK
ncbi:MMPL family transporter [Aquibacillus sp. 3ASR75-11]|uniref:MMPL family transporter n=1 Tax=Terrihalobacillus insolitus TaxID=2950438 RepID=A0A9X3WRI0_9BACI|nr:MMPL family transporter [Terrihalobacillus insolitus]MDC3411951.1 MMPL family transporter [Terrihalobacillus insolitus]MDC3423363.1 MMPL family transporter [Terrihalobacillus insolitus]